MSSEIRQFEALVIPNEALERGGVELLRASIIDGDLHVTLRRAFEQPDHWGGLLSELVRRIARAYAADGKMKEQDVVIRIRSSFVSEAKPSATKPKSKAKSKSNPKAKNKTASKPAKKPARKTARPRKKR